MKIGRKCRVVTTVVCSIITLFVGLIPNIATAETIKEHNATPLAQNEITVLVAQEKESSDIHTVSSGGDDGLAIIGGVFLVLLLIAAVASSSESSN